MYGRTQARFGREGLVAEQQPPPKRFVAGADAIKSAEQTIADFKAQIDAYRTLSSSLDFD